MKYAIETSRLTKRFYHQRGLIDLFRPSRKIVDTIAVNEVTLRVEQGIICGLLGSNGAGKTTFIKMLCTSILPSSGTAMIYGYDITRHEQQVKRLIGLVSSDERSFFWRLTGKQNLRFFAKLYKLPSNEIDKRIEHLFELFDLTYASDVRFNEYSTGMKQKLAIARGLLSRPKILFLDEPTKGLDPISANALRKLIKERVVGHLGNTVLVTTHILPEAEQLCDSIAVMDHGRIVASGSVGDITSAAQKYDKYNLTVQNISATDIQELLRMEDIINNSRLVHTNGAVSFEISLLKNSGAISHVLRYILNNNGKVLKCAIEDTTFEDVFHSIINEQNSKTNI